MYRKGFTLIELLIVVAIIAILAAIAIPNFLAAQIRAKVSSIKGAQRTIATAAESYFIDFNTYPPGWHNAEPQYPECITSPIPYITTIPVDTFMMWRFGAVDLPYYRVIMFFPMQTGVFPPTVTDPYFTLHGVWNTDSWLSDSFGPDQTRGWMEYYYAYHAVPTSPVVEGIYDPTNGTISNGDIVRYGP